MIILDDSTKRRRVELNFKEKHGVEGWEALLKMIENRERSETMALQFSVSNTRIRRVLEALLGTTYGKYLEAQEANK